MHNTSGSRAPNASLPPPKPVDRDNQTADWADAETVGILSGALIVFRFPSVRYGGAPAQLSEFHP